MQWSRSNVMAAEAKLPPKLVSKRPAATPNIHLKYRLILSILTNDLETPNARLRPNLIPKVPDNPCTLGTGLGTFGTYKPLFECFRGDGCHWHGGCVLSASALLY